jgi:tripartite-type tricarboxylate transporter receptor subunit TctC
MMSAPTRQLLVNLSRRDVIKRVGAATGAMLVGGWACAPRAPAGSSCFGTTGRRLRWIVPFPPGGGFDVHARLLEPYYQQALGAAIDVENMPGAGGIVAANTLRGSRSDGLTLGLLNAPGLMVAAMTGESNAPSPAEDFTILGRVTRNRTVWVTGRHSKLRTIDDLLDRSGKTAIVFGASNAGSSNFVSMVVSAHLLGIQAEFITGFAGSRETSMAVVRGEVDLSSFTFESILERIEAQDVRPLLQTTMTRISPHASLDGIALLCGDQGIAARRAAELGRDGRQVEADAVALTRVIEAGLVVAAPPRLDGSLARCLEDRLHDALTDPSFRAAASRARRSLDVGRAAEALIELRSAASEAERFLPLVRDTIRRIRG